VEDPRPVDTALGHQQMQVRVEEDPVPGGLDGDNHAGHDLFAHQGLKMDREGPDRRPAELPKSRRRYLKKTLSVFGIVKTTWR
jgi:hypothetical protein